MKLRELKCENCGAAIKVEENVSQVKCDYCQTTFAVDDAYHDGYKFEKGRMRAHSEQFEQNMEHAKGVIGPFAKVFAAQYIVSAIAGIVIFAIFIILVIVFASKQIDSSNKFDEFDISSFNSSYEFYAGTEYGSRVGRLIDEISTNNKKDKNNQITLKYKETATKDPEQMKEIKKQLDGWTKYEVSFEYDENGFIYLATIEE